jgi:hypothetical protein
MAYQLPGHWNGQYLTLEYCRRPKPHDKASSMVQGAATKHESVMKAKLITRMKEFENAVT